MIMPKISLQGRDLLSITDLSRSEIEHIFKIAKDMEIIVNNRTKSQLLADKILAALFFQPSTRTRLSFTSAMQRLGGTVLGFHSATASRAGDPSYAESLEDTALMVSYYADIIVVRHPEASAPYIFAEAADIPVISGGCGSISAFKGGSSGEHPTQCLLDLYTIYKKRGSLNNLTILCNGNMTSRATTTFCYSMSIFNNCRVLLNYPKRLEFPDDFRKRLEELKVNFEIINSLEDNIPKADVIYVTTMKNALGLKATPDEYVVNRAKLEAKAKDGCLVMHPLPRTDEIAKDVDDTLYGAYFEEAWNGLPIRMALLAMILGRA
jgi:aspartate carbamoyltransferase catalytic subunit